MTFQVTILGSNSAIPAYGRHHTSQYVQIKNQRFLIDCGEAAQNQLMRYKLSTLKLNAIFISHLHGDHYLGLVGLLSSMHLQGRSKPLRLYGPRGLREIITLHFKSSDTVLKYKLIFTPTQAQLPALIFEDKQIEVSTIPLNHRIDCTGFLFREKPHPIRFNKTKLPPNLSLANIATLKKGEDIIDTNGELLYKNSDLTLPPFPQRAYAYCSDTRYISNLKKQLQAVDLLYHEATFLNENELRASNTYHSTAAQAAQLAKEAKAKKLLLGHFSARYKDLKPFEDEARKVFKESYLALEGTTFEIENQ
ncbi:MAG: ribonuclease Z [Cyclobacteriaceae bacterium]|nr:ribonuclease Z [Cyclobacteriaceae bacterium]